jgi:PAS domain-containing protein
VVDAIPVLASSARADGSADFFNQGWLEYTGLSAEQARDWGWTVALHSDDLNGLVDYWRSVVASGKPGEIEGRLRRFDGVYRSALGCHSHNRLAILWPSSIPMNVSGTLSRQSMIFSR